MSLLANKSPVTLYLHHKLLGPNQVRHSPTLKKFPCSLKLVEVQNPAIRKKGEWPAAIKKNKIRYILYASSLTLCAHQRVIQKSTIPSQLVYYLIEKLNPSTPLILSK